MQLFLLFVASIFVCCCLPAQIVISEFHYDNAGGDVGEAIEITGPAGTDFTNYSVILYNGNGGSSYSTLSGADFTPTTFPNEELGFGTVLISAPGLQNGAPDGIALVDPNGMVLQFISYEGSFTASNGPATGITSTDIGVSQTSSTPVGSSLSYDGTSWVLNSGSNTFGTINPGLAAILPVNLLTIEVARLNQAALLTWSTATETGNEFFAIERSGDGRKFEELGRVAGAGDAQTRQDYRFIDQQPLAGVSYYRLRQVDYDGTEEIFGPLVFRNSADTPQPSIFPNPVTDRVQIQHLDETVEQLIILDAQGRQLSILANPLAKANGGIDVAHLPTGLYFLRFVQAGELHSLRFMKK